MSEDTKWICPICQSTEYKEIQRINRDNDIGSLKIYYYECNGCSIHFGDLGKFNAITIIGDVADELLSEYLQTGDIDEGN